MDILDVFALFVIAVLLLVVVVIVVALGSLPGMIARKRGHPQAAAVNVASWVGVATLGILWPLAFVWAFYKPAAGRDLTAANEGPRPAPDPDSNLQLMQIEARLRSLEAELRGGFKTP